MTLAEVKAYLRVDYDDDDALITFLMSVAEEFMIGACGKFDETKAKAKMIYLAAVQNLYDNRALVASSTQGYAVSSNLTLMMRSLLSQLQIEQFMEDSGETGETGETGGGDDGLQIEEVETEGGE